MKKKQNKTKNDKKQTGEKNRTQIKTKPKKKRKRQNVERKCSEKASVLLPHNFLVYVYEIAHDDAQLC